MNKKAKYKRVTVSYALHTVLLKKPYSSSDDTIRGLEVVLEYKLKNK
jgi:hypothetical protein